jgi:hypothetical protein
MTTVICFSDGDMPLADDLAQFAVAFLQLVLQPLTAALLYWPCQ